MPQLSPNYGVLDRASRTPLPHTSSASRLPKASAPPAPQLQVVSPPGSRTHHPNQSPPAASWPAFRERRFRPLSLCSPYPHPPLSLQQSGVRGFPPRGRRVIDESTHAPAPERLGQELFTPALAPNRASPQLLPKAARPHTDTRTPSRRLPAPGARRSPDPRVPVT